MIFTITGCNSAVNQARLAELRHSSLSGCALPCSRPITVSWVRDQLRSRTTFLFQYWLSVCDSIHLFFYLFMQKMSRMQNYFSSEFLASGLSAEFNDFITKITQAKSKTVRTTTHLNTDPACIDVSVFRKKRAWPQRNWPNCPLKWHLLIYPQ